MFATTTKIRTGGRFASGRPDGFFATSAFRLLRAASSGTPGGPAPRGRGLRGELQRHQFSGPIHSAGKLLHTSWLISTSMTTVLLSRWIDAFRGVRIGSLLGPLTPRSVHPASPFLLTKSGPLRAPHSCVRNGFAWENPSVFARLKFENRLRSFRPQCL